MTVLPRVLLVEDDETLGSALRDGLSAARYDVTWCTDATTAIHSVQRSSGVDLVLLDLGLPDADGVDVCRALRDRLPSAVIVILTARDAEIDVVVGLEAGADDYLIKPVRRVELLARLRAHLRRGPAQASAGVHQLEDLRVDVAARRAWLGSRELDLRAKQFDLLARLVSDAGTAVSREALMSDVWDMNWFGSTKTLDVHIAGLRRILDDAALTTGLPAPQIETLRGYGYRLGDPSRDGAGS